ncbi:hypothetical protein [Microbacterium sp. BH-3-3-3]|uniref:hypothetical protein n=1 Tax=Microbacterium sp. BH-3-3-3 TaxID=1906742 RepID=UPI0008929F83|nr:hypothetical protein [Microbacterium sp. BH-3-3-3]AOX46832.1 hypothetical protein BJP65_14365 [Microbacterium sp. BH-3-3-3]
MTDEPFGADDDVADRKHVERERAKLRNFVKNLRTEDVDSGNWFAELCAVALETYTEKATWEYFQERYEGVPPDGIVDQRIKLAARYAALEGGLSASAYTTAIIATLGSRSGAAKATIPAALATLMVDVVFVTQLQLRLAYDISVLYRVPLDVSDPEDLWKLIRVAFTIKSGEVIRESVIKVVPPIMRRVIKRYYSGAVLTTAKSLPVIGKYLLQRNVVKVGIPLVGIPLAVLFNRYSTLIAGRHARTVFRNDARVIRIAEELSERTRHPQLMLWVAWLVIEADARISDDEALLFRHLVKLIREDHAFVDERLAKLLDLDPAEVWQLLEAEPGDLDDVVDAAQQVAAIDGETNGAEHAIISELQDRCDRR